MVLLNVAYKSKDLVELSLAVIVNPVNVVLALTDVYSAKLVVPSKIAKAAI